ncbi:hypothetical protein FA10DRAFT_281115 [Acaromyces ingoldii]|uniref:SigF-like NTF2-like domain-containing protein n=1 Tax=Acaromyces ingoldii TaxID=215250 RepID=A0A316YGJ8_9BASI|nr:hypothetical protein FA10DRAFT_281115 [Acaromyces ingoldii]PWN88650.1 hypothetical protein FA10DRAFT_281115 [Acaromyces ingoldii]
MQDPVREISSVVKGLVQARNATEQRDTLERHFAPDASFDHPLCTVVSGPNSRDAGLLPIYQWLRCMFTPQIEVHNVGFDKEANKLFLDASQKLTPNIFPLSRVYAPVVRLIVVLFLQRGADGKFYIKRQEDYYEPQTLPGKLVPGGELIVTSIKRIAAFNCMLLTIFFGLILGFWRPVGRGVAPIKN